MFMVICNCLVDSKKLLFVAYYSWKIMEGLKDSIKPFDKSERPTDISTSLGSTNLPFRMNTWHAVIAAVVETDFGFKVTN